ncbi:DUF389 domain-containing protein [Ferrimonas marina]|uniref:Uncharacterized hydrophobic domain-containing protein n=1 Tax=Ferrimonas marina TaxID=299255 RepID=A0A1M5X326_9GAMM|nr:DUF389 domain-containing protein [Ferrimonas marina]SHH94210.1 uncharacterized hydrophobic domain-containing protein [Ferrimonas marina]
MTTWKQPLRHSWRKIRLALDRLTGEWHPYIEARIPKVEMAKAMKSASIPSMAFFFLLGLSAAIATFGLLANSAPAIIGAMIIAPLMTPIMGLAYGVVQMSWSQIARSGITVMLGVGVVIGIGYLSARVIGLEVAGTEMLSRAFPTLLDLGVAIAAGAAGAFSLSRESIRSSVAGVAIAVALVPPLSVVGIGLALGRSAAADVGLSFRELGLFDAGMDIATGAFVLFLTNLTAIVAVAGMVMTLQGYARWRRGMAGLATTIIGAVILVQPLGDELHKLQVKSEALRLANTLPRTYPGIFEKALRVDTLSVRYQDDVVHLHIEGFIAEDRVEGAQERLNLYREMLEREIRESVVIETEVIPVQLLKFRSAALPAEEQPEGALTQLQPGVTSEPTNPARPESPSHEP